MNVRKINISHQEGKYSFIHSLHLKIISGYALLIGLLVVIFFVMYHETSQLSLVHFGELRREQSRLLINRISGKLLDLTLPSELLPLWEEEDFQRYHEDNRCAIATLDKLRNFYPESCQCSRIDSISNLLVKRESYLRDLYALLSMNDFEGNRRLPITKAYADSLNLRNETLNNRLDGLIHAFEADAVAQIQKEQRCRDEIRQHSFYLLFLIIVAAFILATYFYILIHRDIRKKVDYRRKLETADRDNRQLLDLHRRMLLSILHDLRSPLGVVSGYAELVKNEPDEQKRKTQTDNILTASAHMLSLTENLLEYYKLDTGGEQLSPSIFSLQKLARELEAAFRPMTENKALALTLNYPQEEITLKGDRERLYRIASNLISNAIKFAPAGTVTVLMKHQEGTLHLQVEDTGCGMNAEEVKLIFNAFERLDKTGETPGFGLGLPITSALVRLLEGTIRVESSPGTGSRFMVSLPMNLTVAGKEKKPAGETYIPEYPERILVIDDDKMQHTLINEMVRRQGISCDCCERAGEVLDRLGKERYNLLISDIQMPETNGFDLLKMLRESDIPQARTIPVLAMTAQIDLQEADYVERGFAGYLSKPFTLSRLMTAVIGRAYHPAGDEEISFESVLNGERQQEEMLEVFVRETRKDMTRLRDAIRDKNMETQEAVLHKIHPLWKSVGVHITYTPTENELPRILEQGERLIRHATRLQSTYKTEEDEKDTDH